MKTIERFTVVLSVFSLSISLLLTGCQAAGQERAPAQQLSASARGGLVAEQVLEGREGQIHYSYRLPEPYDPDGNYPLVMAMPGYGEMWFGEGSSGSNLNWNGFQNWSQLDEPMIVVSAQLTDWGETSARQANELTEYFLGSFPVDPDRIYAAGYSAGGETMSRAVSLRPDLYAAYLHAASQWDGTYAPLAENRTAVYIFMGEDDEYYGSQRARDAYSGLLEAYQDAGMTQAQTDELLVLNIPDRAWFQEKGVSNQHGGGNLIFEDPEVLTWITGHSRGGQGTQDIQGTQTDPVTYTDVPENAWYAPSVEYVTRNGLMTGTGDGRFSPDGIATRAMVAEILYREAGRPGAAEIPGYTDLVPGAWYSDAVAWAVRTGLMTGYGNGTFGPGNSVTREQMATVLWRYGGEYRSQGEPFADETEISSWAADAVDWVQSEGIMTGKSGNRFDPASGLLRSELAAVLFRYSSSGDETDVEAEDRQVLGDLPAEYAYGGWSYGAMNQKLPEPEGNQTVLHTEADPTNIQVLYLWEEGNAPAETRFTPNMTGYFDDWDFRPYVTAIPVREGVKPKGAVVLLAGGAYQFRGNYTDSLPTADALRELGFVTFIVDYRLRPYSQEEGALDVARAVRWIRKNADRYGFDPDNIAVMGFSAGGIQAGEFFMHYDGSVNGTALDPDYVPDELDRIPAVAGACGMIYAFYGRLSVGNMDPDWLRSGDLPPTYYCYGTEDPFYRQFEQQYAVLESMGHPVDRMILQNWPHGFGAEGGWVETYARWLETVWNG